MDQQAITEKLGTWKVEGPEDEPKTVTGSVVEFAFGDTPRSYFVTSYPYRVEYADQSDVRIYSQLNLPFVREKLQQIKPRYIMNIAISSCGAWFLYCYRGPGRFAYDSKWFPRKPSRADGPLGAHLDNLKEEERDQISFCAFGESSRSYFLRSTDQQKDWHPRISKRVPTDLLDAYQDEFKKGCPRAVTFGKNHTWILYGRGSFKWSRHGLPQNLQLALSRGKEEGWSINKAVLNRHNQREYILVFDSGAIYYSFNRDFVAPFKAVIEEWSDGMRRSGRYPEHRASFPLENLDDEDGDDVSDVAYKSTSDDDSDHDNGILKQGKPFARGPHHRQNSSQSQPQHAISLSQSNASNASGKDASESSQPLVAPSTGAAASPSIAILPAVVAVATPQHKADLTRSSSVAPERVPNQPRSPRLEAESEEASGTGEGEGGQKQSYGSTHPKGRGHSRLQSLKENLRDLFS